MVQPINFLPNAKILTGWTTRMRNLPQNHALLSLLLLTGCVRGLCALYSIGWDHPNESFRLLEPLTQLKGYTSIQAWEWTDGLLSIWPAKVHQGLLRVGELFGIHGPLAELIFLHSTYALLSLTQVWAAFRLILFSGGSLRLAVLSGALVGLWPELVYQSVRLMDYSLEATGLALISVWMLDPEKRLFKEVLSGLLLGTLFFIRYQTGLHFFSICILILWIETSPKKKKLQRLLTVGSSYGLTVLALAWIETYWKGDFLSPFLHYLKFNWIENGAARDYGTAPIYRYLSEMSKYYGITGFLAFFLLALHPKSNRKLVTLLFIPITIHSLIPHKEPRFIFGELWLLIPTALSALAQYKPNSLLKAYRNRWIGLLTVLVITGFLVSTYRVAQRFFLFSQSTHALIEAGALIHRTDQEKSNPIYIAEDPVFSPAGFYLRTHAPICYDYPDLKRNKYPCPKEGIESHWDLSKQVSKNCLNPIWQEMGWTLCWVEKNLKGLQ